MEPSESSDLTQTSFQMEYDDFKQHSRRRQILKADWRKRESLQRQHWREWELKYPTTSVLWVMAPKWRRHQDEDVNPHLSEQEREPVAPRYGGNAICQQLRPGDEFGCSCYMCRPRYPSRAQQERWEIELALRKMPIGPRSGRTRVGNAGKGPWVYWDWIGQDGPYITNGKEDYLPEYHDEKCAPEPILDLLSIAKPAKRRKRALPDPGRLSRSLSLAFGRTPREPATASHGIPLDADDISILDFEETWESLDFNLDVGGEGGSESEWERVSQF